MGLIRGGLSLIIGILLFISLIVGHVFLIFNLSITPENIQEQVVVNFDEVIDSVELEGKVNLTQEIKDKFPLIESHCENNTEFVYSQRGYTIDIPCEIVDQGEKAVFEEGIGDIIDEIYTKEYQCESFFKCVFDSENPFYLFSEEAKQSWKNVFYYSLIVSLILIAIMFFLSENKSSFFITIGALFIITSLPFLKIDAFFSFFDNSLIDFVSVLFSEALLVFWINFIVGLIIIFIGIGMKFFNLGGFIMEKLEERKKFQEMKNKVKKKK